MSVEESTLIYFCLFFFNDTATTEIYTLSYTLSLHDAFRSLTKAVYADTEGFVSEMDTRALGMAVVAMGGGRRQASDTIDYSVGFTDMARLGDQVDGQRPLAVIHAKDENSWQDAAKAVKAAIKLADKAPESTPTVYRRISE